MRVGDVVGDDVDASYQRSMAFISRVRGDLRLETRAIRGVAKGVERVA